MAKSRRPASAARARLAAASVGVQLGLVRPLLRHVEAQENRCHRSEPLARSAVDVIHRIEVQNLRGCGLRRSRYRMETVDRAHVDARGVRDADAGPADRPGHGLMIVPHHAWRRMRRACPEPVRAAPSADRTYRCRPYACSLARRRSSSRACDSAIHARNTCSACSASRLRNARTICRCLRTVARIPRLLS